MPDAKQPPPRPAGMLLSPQHAELAFHALAAVAEECKKHGDMAKYGALKHVAVRIKQHVFEGRGVPPETLQRITAKVESAFEAQDWAKAQDAVMAMLAAVGRMDPDPPALIAKMLAPGLVRLTVTAAQQQQRQLASQVLRQLLVRLDADREGFESDGWVASSQATFDYTRSMVDFMASELEAGLDPFDAQVHDDGSDDDLETDGEEPDDEQETDDA